MWLNGASSSNWGCINGLAQFNVCTQNHAKARLADMQGVTKSYFLCFTSYPHFLSSLFAFAHRFSSCFLASTSVYLCSCGTIYHRRHHRRLWLPPLVSRCGFLCSNWTNGRTKRRVVRSAINKRSESQNRAIKRYYRRHGDVLHDVQYFRLYFNNRNGQLEPKRPLSNYKAHRFSESSSRQKCIVTCLELTFD